MTMSHRITPVPQLLSLAPGDKNYGRLEILGQVSYRDDIKSKGGE